MMKRRTFLGLLGLAPVAVPMVAQAATQRAPEPVESYYREYRDTTGVYEKSGPLFDTYFGADFGSVQPSDYGYMAVNPLFGPPPSRKPPPDFPVELIPAALVKDGVTKTYEVDYWYSWATEEVDGTMGPWQARARANLNSPEVRFVCVDGVWTIEGGSAPAT